MLFLCHPTCSTCAKARAYLQSRGIAYTERDIRDPNPTADELREWIGRSGLPVKKFFNTTGMLYRSMNLKDRLGTMTEEEQIALLATDGMLVKRPLLIGDDFVLVGFRQKEWEVPLGLANKKTTARGGRFFIFRIQSPQPPGRSEWTCRGWIPPHGGDRSCRSSGPRGS